LAVPELKTHGWLQPNPVRVCSHAVYRLIHSTSQERADVIPIDYPHLNEIPPGTCILFDDGLVESQVIENRGNELIIRITNDGPRRKEEPI
jgi:pyruvate kinase